MNTKTFGIIGGLTLVAGVLGYSLFKSKPQPISTQERDKLLTLLQELKHQIFMISVQYSKVFKSLGANEDVSQEQIRAIKEKEIMKIYDNREKILLLKYTINKAQFANLLEKTFSKDKEIQRFSGEIERMLLDTIEGKQPSLEVPQELKEALKPSVALKLFMDIQLELLETLLSRAWEHAQENPEFSVESNEAVGNLIKQINLFKVKLNYLKRHGPQVESCTHENFAKVIEGYKKESPKFKAKVVKFETLYVGSTNKLGQKIDFEELRNQFMRIYNGEDKEEEKIQNIIEEIEAEGEKGEGEKEGETVVVVEKGVVEDVVVENQNEGEREIIDLDKEQEPESQTNPTVVAETVEEPQNQGEDNVTKSFDASEPVVPEPVPVSIEEKQADQAPQETHQETHQETLQSVEQTPNTETPSSDTNLQGQ